MSSYTDYSAFDARSAGDGEADAIVAAELGKASNAGTGAAADALEAAKSMMERLPLFGSFLGFAMAIAITAFVLVMVLWFDNQRLGRQVKKMQCDLKPISSAMKQGSSLILGTWSTVVAPVALLTGAANVPLLFSVATPAGTTPTTSGQSNTGSVQGMLHDAQVEGLSIQLPAPLTAGSATFTVMVNRVATKVSATLDPSMGASVVAPVCLQLHKGDYVSVSMTTAAGTASSAAAFTPTVQLWARVPVMSHKKHK